MGSQRVSVRAQVAPRPVSAIAAIAILGLTRWRTRRQQTGQPTLLNDAAFQQLLQTLQRLEERKAGPPTPPPAATT